MNTTVHPKTAAFPTDARLYLKGLRKVVQEPKRAGMGLQQSYTLLAVQAFLLNERYGKAKQMKRARRMQKRLKVYRRRGVSGYERKLVAGSAHQEAFSAWLPRIERILILQRHDQHKLYSVHAPKVECLAKDKADKPYECGGHVSVRRKSV